ncbi:MAG: nucleoside 2-deoxyribosyltransferase domain-containing protein [Flammeovirgaceae bacterium]
MAIQIYAPHSYEDLRGIPKVFLAGSIDNGQAEDWQTWLFEQLTDIKVVLLNPRRPDWDSQLECDRNNPQFREQVEWELNGLHAADFIAMYFAPNSKAPISLLEMGLFAQSKKMIVCCPKGYWRKGNVDIVCERYHIKQVETIEELLKEIQLIAG